MDLKNLNVIGQINKMKSPSGGSSRELLSHLPLVDKYYGLMSVAYHGSNFEGSFYIQVPFRKGMAVECFLWFNWKIHTSLPNRTRSKSVDNLINFT